MSETGKPSPSAQDPDKRAEEGPGEDRTVFSPPAAPDPEAQEQDARTLFVPTDVPPAEPAPEGSQTGPLPPATEAPRFGVVTVGTLINNNYEVTEILKAGGMGEVYRGIEIGTGDPVAIKAILPELAEDEKAAQMFKREARTLRQLSDEAIVRYYNYVHDRDLNRYFLVMEFVEGVTLSDFVEHFGAIQPQQARALMKRLARGLSRAHAHGVIHRDLSPDNVMLPHRAVAEARLIDFGIAKSGVMGEATMHGQFAGKFKYVAPEQLGHYAGEITPATDIYGLALLISAAVIGQPLDMGGSVVEAVQARQSIPDLSGTPADLRPILSYMLEPDPGQRPASMVDLIALLDDPAQIPPRYRGGLPMTPTPQRTGTAGLSRSGGVTSLPPGLQVPGTMTGMPYTQRGAALPPPPEQKDRTGSKLIGLMAGVFLAILGGAGYYAWDQGLIDLPVGAGADTGEKDVAQDTGSTGIGAPMRDTREGFLASFDTGACSLMSRIPTGPNAGVIEEFSTSGKDFAGLSSAYEEKFGARPALLARQIAPPQCAVLDFVRALQGRGLSGPSLVLPKQAIASGESITAALSVPGDQTVWVALISPLGAVYNLTGRLSDPAGGQRSLSFGLNLAEGSEAVPQLLLAIASDTPLTRAAAAQDGVQAVDLLPQVLQEIAARGGAGSATLSYLRLDPTAAAPENTARGSDAD